MEKSIIHSQSAPQPIGPYSQAVWAGNVLFISGQIALDASNGQMYTGGDIQEETRRVMKNIEAILVEAGLSFDHIIKSSIFILDMNQFAQINEAYGSFLRAPYPARETVEVKRLPKDARVEISVIAMK